MIVAALVRRPISVGALRRSHNLHNGGRSFSNIVKDIIVQITVITVVMVHFTMKSHSRRSHKVVELLSNARDSITEFGHIRLIVEVTFLISLRQTEVVDLCNDMRSIQDLTVDLSTSRCRVATAIVT